MSSPHLSTRLPSHGRSVVVPPIEPRGVVRGNRVGANVVEPCARNSAPESGVDPFDRGIHPTPSAVDTATGTAAVAGVNRGIGLEIIRNIVAAGLEQFVPAFSAD